MPYPLTIPTQIDIGRVSMYLARKDVTVSQFNRGIPYFEKLLPLLIAMETDSLSWQYDMDSSTSTLYEHGGYLYALCGRYAIEAQVALGNTSGVVVIPTASTVDYLIKLRNYPQFIVGSVDSPMSQDDTVLVISDTDIVPESRDGEVEVHLDGAELGQSVLGRDSYTPVYSSGQYTITFNQGVLDNNLVTIKYPVRVTLVAASSLAPASSDVIYSITVEGTDTGTLVNPDGDIYIIAAGTQGMLSIQLVGQDEDNNAFAGYWQYYVNNLGGTITLALSNGGIYQPYSGGDINSNIAISGDDGLGGVKIEGTGFTDKTITFNAKFSYSNFDF